MPLNPQIWSLLLMISTSALQNPSSWSPPKQPVYVVSRNTISEGYEPSSARFGDLLMIQIFPKVPEPADGNQRIDGSRFYEKGKTVALFVDGERRGDVRIDSIKDYQCNWAAALVAPTAADLPRNIVGLATNSDIELHQPGRRKATESE